MPKKVPNIQRIINNDIIKIENIVFSGGGGEIRPEPRHFLCTGLYLRGKESIIAMSNVYQ
jgi:hypothetical protein